MAKIIKKLSTATIVGKFKCPEEGVKVDLFTVAGVAHDIKTGTSQYGDYVALIGKFRVQRSADGEMFDAGTLFLPSVVNDMVVSEIASGASNSVEFAFKVGVIGTIFANKPSYEYTAEALLEPTDADPLENLWKRLPLQIEDKKGKTDK